MLDWTIYAVMALSFILLLYSIAFFFTKDQVLLKLKALMNRKAKIPSMLAVELLNNRQMRFRFTKYNDGQTKIHSKVYSVDKKHIMLNPEFGLSACVVSEATSKSVDPETLDNNPLSPTVIDKIIKRVKMASMGEALKLIKIFTIIMAGQLVLLVGVVFFIVKFYFALEEQGITIRF